MGMGNHMKFAVFGITDPNRDNGVYRLLASILEYDVRAGRCVPLLDALQHHPGGWNQAWTKAAMPYGPHVTIGDVRDFVPCNLLPIQREIDDLLAGDPDVAARLQAAEIDRAFDLEHHLRHAGAIIDRALAESGE